AKALIGSKLSRKEPVTRQDLRPILLSAAARYTALELKIPGVRPDSWKYAIDLVSYMVPSSSRHLTLLKKIVLQYHRFYNPL
ncbi:Uncharacterized protein FKW44_008836, partial [Caligus rogercresseyi]